MEAEILKLLKEFIAKDYDGFPCIMYMVEDKELIVLFKHWQQVDWRKAPKVYLGRIKSIKNLKPTYKWLV